MTGLSAFILATTADIGMPNIVAAIPGVDAAATAMMKSLIGSKGVSSIQELRATQSRAVRMIACQMTMDLFGYTMDDMIEGLLPGSAASYIETASDSEINLCI